MSEIVTPRGIAGLGILNQSIMARLNLHFGNTFSLAPAGKLFTFYFLPDFVLCPLSFILVHIV